MKRVSLAAATLVAAALLAVAQTPEPTYTLTFAGRATTKATLSVRCSPGGLLDAATVSIARLGSSPKRDQSRVTAEEIGRTPGVLTPVKLFVTETWESGKDLLDVSGRRTMVLTGFTKDAETVVLERLPDEAESSKHRYKLDGPISHWQLTTDGRRLVSLNGNHGVGIEQDGP